jgi:WD40 repeat protein
MNAQAKQPASDQGESVTPASNITNPKELRVIRELKVGKPLLRCCFDLSEKNLFAAGQDRRIWRVAIEESKSNTIDATEMNGHESWVLALKTHPQGDLLLSAGGDGNLIWWSLREDPPKIVRKVAAHRGWIRDLALSPDGKLVATAGNDRLVKIWDVDQGKLLTTFAGHAWDIYRLVFHPDGKQLLSGDLTCLIKCWEIGSGKMLRELHAPSLHRIDKNHNLHLGGTRALSFDAEGKQLAASGLRAAPNYLGGEVQPGNVIFDFESGNISQEQKTKDNLVTVPWESFFDDGTLVVCTAGKAGGHLLFWKVDAEDEFYSFALPDAARDMAINRARHHIATAHADGHLRISSLLPADSDAEIS